MLLFGPIAIALGLSVRHAPEWVLFVIIFGLLLVIGIGPLALLQRYLIYRLQNVDDDGAVAAIRAGTGAAAAAASIRS